MMPRPSGPSPSLILPLRSLPRSCAPNRHERRGGKRLRTVRRGYGPAAHLEVGEGDGDRADCRRRRLVVVHGDGAAPDQAGRSCSCSCSAAGGWRSPSGSRPHGTVHLIYLPRRSLSPRVTARGWRAAAVVVSSLAPVEEVGAYLYQITVSGGTLAPHGTMAFVPCASRPPPSLSAVTCLILSDRDIQTFCTTTQ
jgi:hypothetical protein